MEATGRKPTKVKEASDIHIMQWNAEGVSNKKEELEQFLHANNINICWIQETHLQEGKPFNLSKASRYFPMDERRDQTEE